jgi:hypothetical protein
MPISTPDFQYRLSGGAANAVGNASLGGVISSNAMPAAVDALFDVTPAAEAAAGRVEYRCIYVRNGSGTDVMTDLRVFIASNTPLAGTNLSIGVGTSAVNGTEQTIANETTAPVGVTFSEPTTADLGVVMGNVPAGQHRALWLRRTVTAGSGSSPDDPWQLGARCETA